MRADWRQPQRSERKQRRSDKVKFDCSSHRNAEYRRAFIGAATEAPEDHTHPWRLLLIPGRSLRWGREGWGTRKTSARTIAKTERKSLRSPAELARFTETPLKARRRCDLSYKNRCSHFVVSADSEW